MYLGYEYRGSIASVARVRSFFLKSAPPPRYSERFEELCGRATSYEYDDFTPPPHLDQFHRMFSAASKKGGT